MSLKSVPSGDGDVYCGFIFRLEEPPRTAHLKLFRQHDQYTTYLGCCNFTVSSGVSKTAMVLDKDGTTVQLAVLCDVVQHIHQVLSARIPFVHSLSPYAYVTSQVSYELTSRTVTSPSSRICNNGDRTRKIALDPRPHCHQDVARLGD